MSKYIVITADKDTKTIIKTLTPFIPLDECSFIPIYGYNSKAKIPTKTHKQYIEEEIIPFVKENSGEYVLVFDANYFKLLANQASAAKYLGYVIPTDLAHIVYVPSYKTALYNPKVSEDIAQALKAVQSHVSGSYKEPGKDIITNAIYPTISGTKGVLDILHHYDKLTCDIETWSLKHYNSSIATIAFCWNEHEGTVLTIDVDRDTPCEKNRAALREFFETYKGTLIFHNITYDAYILVYQLYMKDLQDTEGMLRGMDVLLKNFEDTKLIAYLATNSCAGNSLGLKTLAQEFAGNYAQEEIDNIDSIPREELLEYNLIDGLSTWFVYNKYYPKMVEDNQEHIYKTLFKPAVRDIIQMQLTGLPLDMNKVLEAEKQMETIRDNALSKIHSSSLVQEYMEIYKEQWAEKKNSTYKNKRVTSADCPDIFNPSSNLMLKGFIYDFLSLPVIEKTPSKEPATGKDVLAKLMAHTQSQEVKDILQALIEFKEVIKILTAFIPAFKNAVPAKDGRHYLFGSQNSTGTVSGRYSANSPNLANLPSTGTKFAKLIKECFSSPKGTIFVGIDFSSLEDRISALVTKDSNKLKVYAGVQKYSLVINGKTHIICEDTIVNYDGKQITGKNLYELLQSSKS